jgi:PEP-CTERM motif
MKRFIVLAAISGLAFTGTGRADFIYTFTTITRTDPGDGSVRVTIDVPKSAIANGYFDAGDITSFLFQLGGTSPPLYNFSNSNPTDLIGLAFVNSTTGAFTSSPQIITYSGDEAVEIFSGGGLFVVFYGNSEDNVASGSGEWNVSFIPVPEPASLILLGIGTVGVVGYGWRKRKRAAA